MYHFLSSFWFDRRARPRRSGSLGLSVGVFPFCFGTFLEHDLFRVSYLSNVLLFSYSSLKSRLELFGTCSFQGSDRRARPRRSGSLDLSVGVLGSRKKVIKKKESNDRYDRLLSYSISVICGVCCVCIFFLFKNSLIPEFTFSVSISSLVTHLTSSISFVSCV